jgi:hypothetical protein
MIPHYNDAVTPDHGNHTDEAVITDCSPPIKIGYRMLGQSLSRVEIVRTEIG